MARKRVVNIDLTDPVNANWRDRLRANPNDPAYAAPIIDGEQLQAIYLEPVDKPPVEGAANKQGYASLAKPNVVSLKRLYDFVKKHKGNHEAVRLERTALGKEYCRLCDEIAAAVDEQPGFYLWGRYDKKGLWQNIYLGMAGYRENKKNLRKRIAEELKDERSCIWRHAYTEEELLKIGETIHPIMWEKRNYKWGWVRSMRKAGATHIVWAPVAGVRDEDVKRIESDLIEALNPTANRTRPTPPHSLQTDTVVIFKALRSSIHGARDQKFLIGCPS